MAVTVTGPRLAVETCARRLAPLGADPAGDVRGGRDGSAPAMLALDGLGGEVAVEVSWYGPAPLRPRPGSEGAVQALCGLMQVHGRDAGEPQLIGVEVASVAAGLLASQAVLAALVGCRRGAPTPRVATSVLQAGLVLVSHRLAGDSSGQGWNPVAEGPAPGPPFRSADGAWVEIETLDPSAWTAFWQRLGGDTLDVEWAWWLFRPRYFRGRCTLPAGFHEAMAAHSLADLETAAAACGVSLQRVRGYDEVLADPGWWWGHPPVTPTAAAPAPAAPPARGSTTGGGVGLPLAGLRVVESTTRLQGPLPTQLLAQLGATVTRVEPPGGDPFRSVPPLLDEVGSFYRCVNRGKTVVELDLSQPAGRDALCDLAGDADVFIHNWRPGKAAEWQLDADRLAAVNPQLVYAHASGWGERPEARRLVGTDFLVQAFAAVGAGIRADGDPPVPSRALLTDYFGALATTEALLRGLYARERTGCGQQVEGSLLMGAMALQAHVLDGLAAGATTGRRGGRPPPAWFAGRFATADGPLWITAADAAARRRLAVVCGAEEGDRAAVERRLRAEPTAVWEARLAEAGLACAPVCTDLGALPAEPRLAGLCEPLAAGAAVPANPWQLDASTGG